MKVLLIVPAFNEGVKLERVAERVDAYRRRSGLPFLLDVVLADDASTDGVPERLCAKHGYVWLRSERRAGVGCLIRMAYDWGLKHGHDVLVTMAGNNKDNPEEIDRLVEPIIRGEFDFVQGSRYLPGGDFGKMPAYRLFATRMMHPWLFSLMSGKKITDSTNGFRAVRSSLLHDSRIQLHQDWLDRYELEPYLFYQAIRFGYLVTEVPVSKIYPNKKLGYSKMIPVISWWSILKPLFFLFFRIKK